MIGKDKERLIVTVTKEEKELLQKIADDESRSLSNLVGVIIKEFLKTHKKK